MDDVIRYLTREVELTEDEVKAGKDPWEIVEDVLYKGPVDKVLRWLEIAAAAPTAEFVVLSGSGERLTIEQYKHKYGEK